MHDEAPAGDHRPAGQGPWQDGEVLPWEDAYRPAGQEVQVLAPAKEYFPAAQEAVHKLVVEADVP